MTFFKHNDQHFSYTNDLLTIDIFGGVEGHLIDGLFATLKISLADSSRPPIRHNLDLFNDNQMTRLITKVCERLEVGHSVVSSSLSEVVEYLEAERLKLFEAVEETDKTTEPLTSEEKKAATQALKSTDLMKRTLKAFEVIGICGEAYNAMILYLAMLSRKLSDPLSVICMARTGAGKSYLVEKIAACLPPHDIREYTQLTAASLYHHPKNDLAGKVLLIEDLFGAKGAMFPIKELQTKKRISKTMTIKDRTGHLKAMTFVVEGPLCVIACTAYDKIFTDNANRCLLLSLDNSSDQDRRIMEYQKKAKAGLIDSQKATITEKKLKDMQQVLKPVTIINPYAPLIELPNETLYPRRTLPLILNFIEAVTFYHQYQREEKVNEQTGEVYIETHPDDIRWTFELLREVLFAKSDELAVGTRSFYEWLHDWAMARKMLRSAGQPFYATSIREDLRIHPRTLSRYLKELTDYGLLKITGGNRHTTGYSYTLTIQPDTNKLNDSIRKQLDKVLARIEEAHKKNTSKSVDTKPA